MTENKFSHESWEQRKTQKKKEKVGTLNFLLCFWVEMIRHSRMASKERNTKNTLPMVFELDWVWEVIKWKSVIKSKIEREVTYIVNVPITYRLYTMVALT